MGCLNLSTLFSFAKIDDEKSFAHKDVDEILVNMSSEAIHIYRSQAGGEVRFRYYGNSWPARKLVAENVNGKVSVSPDGLCRIGDLKLDIYLPADYRKALVIKASSGAVNMEPVDLEDLRLDLSSGSLTAESINATSAVIHSSSGSVDVRSIAAARLEITSQSGSIKTGRCTCEEAAMETSSGGILLSSVAGNFELKSTSGKISLTYPEFDNFKVKVNATSGPVTLELPANAGFNLEAQATSGNIHSDFPVAGEMGRNKVSGQVGEGRGQVSLHTTSGNISILKLK